MTIEKRSEPRTNRERLIFMAIQRELGIVLSKRFEELGITKGELAQRVYANKKEYLMIHKILAGESLPHARTLVRLALALHCDLEIHFGTGKVVIKKAGKPLPEHV